MSDVEIDTNSGGISSEASITRIDRIQATFDNEHLVAYAGLLLVPTLAVRLGIEDLINATVRLVCRVDGALPGRKC